MILLKPRAVSYAAAIVAVHLIVSCGGGGGSDNFSTASVNKPTTDATYSVTGNVTGLPEGASIALQNNGKDQLNVNANGTFTFATALHSGDAYSVAITTQPSATTFCAVSNGSGTLASSPVTNILISCGAAHYAYVADFSANTISQYVYGPGGGLIPLKTPAIQTGTKPAVIALNPTADYLYVVNNGDNSISQFSIGTGGRLTPMPVATVPTGSGPSSMTIEPTGHYAYVPNVFGHSIYQYTIDANGSLAPMATPFVTAGTNEYFRVVAIEPAGHYAYALSDHGIYQFAINADGTLTLLASSPVYSSGLSFPVGIAATANNVYAVYHGGTAQYIINANGLLSPMSPATVNTGSFSSGIAIDPFGKFAYIPNQPGTPGSPISQYTIGEHGALTQMAEPPASGGNVSLFSQTITVDSTGKYVYVAVSGNVLQYTIGSGGALTPMAAPVATSGSNSISIITK